MAISKEKDLNNGFSADYWKIISEHYDRIPSVISWEIALFKDHETSVGGGHHTGVVKVYSTPISHAAATGNTISLGYTYIATKAASTAIPPGGTDPVVYDVDLAGGIMV